MKFLAFTLFCLVSCIGVLRSLDFTNCAPDSAITITKLTITPDPIKIPGDITIGLDAIIKSEVKSISKATLKLEYKVLSLFYVTLPKSTFDNICHILSTASCPNVLVNLGINCRCPFAAKGYKIPDGIVSFIPENPIILSGDYRITFTLSDGSTTLACYKFEASLIK